MKFPSLSRKAIPISQTTTSPSTIRPRGGLERKWSGLAAVVAIVTLFLLAASLNNLEFKPGESFILPQGPRVPSGSPALEFPAVLFDAFLVLLGIALLISLVIMARSPRDRRLLLRNVGQVLLLAVIGLLVSSLYRSEEKLEVQTTPGARAPSPVSGPVEMVESLGTPAPVTFAPPVVPGWVRYAATLVAIGLVGVLGYWGWRFFHNPKEQLHEITRSALDDLFAGRNWEDVVIQCYADMNTAVSRRRGVGRHQAMTPREFGVRLEHIGLPTNSVNRLTRLFEQARYGSHRSTPDQIREATDCLAEIMGAVAAE